MEALIVILLLFLAVNASIIAFVLYSLRKIALRGEDVNRLTKSLVLTLGGIIGARVARSALKKVLR